MIKTLDIPRMARICAREAIIRLSASDKVSRQDIEDIRQAAALGVCKALKVKPDAEKEGYYWKAAKYEAIKFIILRLWGKNPFYNVRYIWDDEDLEDTLLHPTDTPEIIPIEQEKLTALLLASRNKKGARGMAASQRDTKILMMLLQGYGNKAIADEFNTKPYNIRSIRVQIQRRLQKILSAKFQDDQPTVC